jgi:hypothetical protein
MKNYLYITLGVFGLALQLLVIGVLVRGPYKKYGLFFVYLLVLFLTTIADFSAFIELGTWPYYFMNDFVRQFALVAAVISLVHKATTHDVKQNILPLKLVLAVAVVTGLSFYFSTGQSVGLYFTKVARNLSFATVLLNVVLWFALLKYSRKDYCLLLVSGGLGLNMAGEAIGQSLRQMSRSTVFAGNLIGVLSHLLCLYIWWVAFRRLEIQAKLPEHAVSG